MTMGADRMHGRSQTQAKRVAAGLLAFSFSHATSEDSQQVLTLARYQSAFADLHVPSFLVGVE